MKEIKNKKAAYEYFLEDKIEVGMVLTGTEIKSIRAGEANLTDAYCIFVKNELIVKSIYIAPYKQGSYQNHEPRRDRKLLLKKQELKKIHRKIKEKGYSVIPYRIYFSERGLAKLEIAMARGKKKHDKRDSIKQKDVQRDMDRSNKMY